jgi:hypothetical protein
MDNFYLLLAKIFHIDKIGFSRIIRVIMYYQATQNLWNATKTIITIVVGLLVILLELRVAKFG